MRNQTALSMLCPSSLCDLGAFALKLLLFYRRVAVPK
jgi:hypothetical protein